MSGQTFSVKPKSARIRTITQDVFPSRPRSAPAIQERPKEAPLPARQGGRWLQVRGTSQVFAFTFQQPGCLWERQKGQLPQFPNMSNRVQAFCALSVPLYADERLQRVAIFLFIIALSPVITKALKCLMLLPGSNGSQALLERGLQYTSR